MDGLQPSARASAGSTKGTGETSPPASSVPAAEPWWDHPLTPSPMPPRRADSWKNKHLGVTKTCPGEESSPMLHASSQRNNEAPPTLSQKQREKSAVRQSSIPQRKCRTLANVARQQQEPTGSRQPGPGLLPDQGNY